MQGFAIVVALVVLTLTPSLDVACDPTRHTIFQLKCADAAKIAKRLRTLLGGQDESIVTDEASNTVFIRAAPEKLEQAKRIINRLDVRWPNYLTIVPLQNIDAASVSRPLHAILTLAAFLRGDERGIRINVDEKGNSIIIRAGAETMQQAKEILRWLDGVATNQPALTDR